MALKHTLGLGLGLLLLAAPVLAQDEETFTLSIAHVNDVHAHYEPDADGNYGAALMTTVVNRLREENENFLFLDAGDRFTGTLFHTQYLGQDSAEIMRAQGVDAMALGNHEFDNGDDVLAAFIDAVDFPVLSANIDFSASPYLADLVQPYVVLDVNGEQVGVIGLTTPETQFIASPGPELVWNEDVVAVTQAAVDELTADGVNKIIVLSHMGLEPDTELAQAVTGVDLIVGGHSHDLLSNTYTAAVGEYPLEFESSAGEPVLVVQSGEYSEFVGFISLTFTADGVLDGWDGDTIMLTRYITPDAEVETLVTTLAGPIEVLRQQPVGESSVFLVGDRTVCRVEECNLGNLITDALLAETGAQIAITNGGGIRADIDEGEVTLGEVLTVLPFGNTVATMQLTGADVVAALEGGVSAIALNDAGLIERSGASGRFPQVAGIRFTFDPTQEAGSRIVSVEVLGEDGEYAPIDESATYDVVTNDFMRRGGDEYTVFAENAVNPYDFGRPMDEVVAEYIGANSPVAPETEGRITSTVEVAPQE